MRLLKGDCLHLMPKIPSHSIDLILADLPYGITNASWDTVIPFKPLWKQYARLIKSHGAIVLFGTEPFASKVRLSASVKYRYDWIWKKTMPTLFLMSHHRPLRDYENIMVFYKHLPTYHPQMRWGFKPYKGVKKQGHRAYKTRSGVFASDKLPNKTEGDSKGERYPVQVIKFANPNNKRYHPTEKPIPLLKYLIKTYTDPGNIVLDNVMGSGSTGVAAMKLHRRFIGIEKDDHYFKVARKRLNKINILFRLCLFGQTSSNIYSISELPIYYILATACFCHSKQSRPYGRHQLYLSGFGVNYYSSPMVYKH